MIERHTASTITDDDLDALYERLAEVIDSPASPIQHAPGKAIRCPDCRARGYAVCLNESAATYRLGRIREAARLHRQRLISTYELYAVIEALDPDKEESHG